MGTIQFPLPSSQKSDVLCTLGDAIAGWQPQYGGVGFINYTQQWVLMNGLLGLYYGGNGTTDWVYKYFDLATGASVFAPSAYAYGTWSGDFPFFIDEDIIAAAPIFQSSSLTNRPITFFRISDAKNTNASIMTPSDGTSHPCSCRAGWNINGVMYISEVYNTSVGSNQWLKKITITQATFALIVNADITVHTSLKDISGMYYHANNGKVYVIAVNGTTLYEVALASLDAFLANPAGNYLRTWAIGGGVPTTYIPAVNYQSNQIYTAMCHNGRHIGGAVVSANDMIFVTHCCFPQVLNATTGVMYNLGTTECWGSLEAPNIIIYKGNTFVIGFHQESATLYSSSGQISEAYVYVNKITATGSKGKRYNVFGWDRPSINRNSFGATTKIINSIPYLIIAGAFGLLSGNQTTPWMDSVNLTNMLEEVLVA